MNFEINFRAASSPPSRINRADDGFEGIHQQCLFGPATCLLFTSSHVEILPEAKLLGILHKICRTDEKTL